jgi:DNA-binding CsgD family transcriptional regulator
MTDELLDKPLTKPERDCLALLCQMLSDREIAAKLQISLNTLRWYRAQICRKLGVSTRQEIIQRAAELGLCGGDGTADEAL